LVVETIADAQPADPRAAQRSRCRCAIALILFTVFGLACRVRQFAADQSLWQDESALMLNVRAKPPMRLITEPLNVVPLSQAAPPMYLLTLKFILQTAGPREWAMRIPAFVCAVAALICFAVFAWQIAPPLAAVWAVALFACCEGLIFESAAVKPYSGDTLAAVVLLWIGMSNAPPLRRMIAATVAGLLLLGFAYSTIFIFAAVSLCLLPMLWPSPRGRIGWLACNAAMGLGFLAIYLFCIRRQRVPMLELFWIDRFAPLAHPLRIPFWLISRLWEIFIYAQPPFGGVLLITAIGGAIVLCKLSSKNGVTPSGRSHLPPLPCTRGRGEGSWNFQTFTGAKRERPLTPTLSPDYDSTELVQVRGEGEALHAIARLTPSPNLAPLGGARWMLVLPFLLATLAGIAHAYPLGGGRLSTYLLPPAFLLTGLGIAQFCSAWPLGARRAWRIIFGAVLAVSVAFAAAGLVQPQSFGDSRDAIAWLRAHRTSGEHIYVVESSREDYLWYAGPTDGLVTMPVMANQTVGGDVPAGQSFWVIGANKTRHPHAAFNAFTHLPGFTADAARSRKFHGGFAICYRK
jgi:hypothetical protein